MGEVGSFLRGKSILKSDFVEKGMPCIHYGQVHTKFGISVNKHLSEIPIELYKKSIIASPGDTIIAITSEDLEGSCKSTDWLGNNDVAVSAHAAVYKHDFVPKFIPYYLRSHSFYLEKEKYARGFKVMEIKPSDLAKIPVPIPSKETQNCIVSELDDINDTITMLQQQVSDLDILANSIFYDMFGDPIQNPMAWPIKKLGEVCQSDLGKTLNASKDKGNYYPYLCAINVLWNKIETKIIKQTRFEESELERYSVRKGDLLVCEGGDIGRAAIWDKNEPIQYQNALHRLRFNDDVSARYILTFLYILKISGELDGKYGKGVTIKHLVKSSLLSIPTPIPPLALQKNYASKIANIEEAKANINSQIAEMQTLLAARMQYWFD